MSTSVTGSAPGGWTPPSVEELQQLLPQYEIESVLGQGGMGAVYKGKQAALQRPVAIKVLPETLISGDNDHHYVERFKLEARSMASLDHPAIISVFDFGQTTAGHLYFVMEFIDGMDIEQYIAASGGQVDPDHAVAIVSHVLDALDYAHSKGIVHRDIKPANVLINREGRVKIADFGLAKQFGGEDAAAVTALTMTNVAMGTPDYIAPEALEVDASPDHRADLYAVGVMLFRMLTGKLPRGMFKLPSEQIPGLDVHFDDIIALAMESDPAGRFQNASEFRGKLDDLQSEPVTRMEAHQDTGAVSPAVSGRVMQLPQQDLEAESAPPSRPVSQNPDPGRTRKKKTGLWVSLGAGALLLAVILPLVVGSKTKEEPPGNPQDSTPTVEATGASKSTRDEQARPATSSSGDVSVDLLSLVNVSTDSIRGNWKFEGDGLVRTDEPGPATIRLPATASSRYTFRATLTPLDEEAGSIVILPVADHHVQLVIGGFREHEDGPVSGLSRVEGKIPAGNETAVFHHLLRANISYLLEIRVNESGGTVSIEADIDNESLVRWEGPVEDLSLDLKWWDEVVDDKRFLYLHHAFPTVTRFSKLTLVNTGTQIDTGSAPPRKAEAQPVETDLSKREQAPSSPSVTPASVTGSKGKLSPAVPEPASATSTLPIPEIPDLQSRLSSYRKYRKQTIGKLIVEHRTRLTQAKKSAIAAGQLEGVDQSNQALAGLQEYGAELGALLDAEPIVQLPLPRPPADLLPQLASSHAKFRDDLIAAEADMGGKLEQSLTVCQAELTKQNKIQEARAVRDYWNALEIVPAFLGPATPDESLSETATSDGTWTTMFNGNDLTGWKIIGDSRAFSVVNGAIRAKNPGPPANLYWTDGGETAKTLRDFEVTFRAKSEGNSSNSGFYFHMAEEMKYTTKFPDEGHEIQLANDGVGVNATGGLFSTAAPLFHLQEIDDWFDVRILVQGKHVQCWMNGKQTLDFTEPDNLPPATPHQHERISPVGGGIALQANSRSGAWYFDDLRIRALASGASVAGSESNSTPWTELFNGQNWDRWGGKKDGWRIESGGALSDTAGPLFIPFDHREFEIEGELLTSANGNGGVFFLTGLDPSKGYELALIGSGRTSSGGIYTGGLFAPHENFKTAERISPAKSLIQDDTWTSFRIHVTQDLITTWIEGTKAVEYPITFPALTATHIGIQGGRGTTVGYRKLRARPLP